MASITSFANEKSLALGNREALIRQFDFGSWTEIRIGMLFGFIGNTGNTSSIVTETVSVLGATDKVYFGIKSSGSNIPGNSGSNFLGVGTISTSTQENGATGQKYVDGGFTTWYVLYPTAISSSATAYQPLINASLSGLAYPTPPLSEGNFNGFYGLKFILNNSGSVSQSISMTYKRSNTNNGTGSIQLQSALLNDSSWAGWSEPATASWVTGTPLPDCFFAYSPLYNNRLRMSAIQAIKIR